MKKILLLLIIVAGLYIKADAQSVLVPTGKTTELFSSTDSVIISTTVTKKFTLGGNHQWIYTGHYFGDYITGMPSYTWSVEESLFPGNSSLWKASTVPSRTHTTAVDTSWMWTDTIPAGSSIRIKLNATTTVQRVNPSARIRAVWFKP